MKQRLPWWWKIGFVVLMAGEAVAVAAALPAKPELANPLMLIGFAAIVILFLTKQIAKAWPVTVAFGVLVLVPGAWTLLH